MGENDEGDPGDPEDPGDPTASGAGGSPDLVVDTSPGSLFLPTPGQPGSACLGKEICQGRPDVYGQAPTSAIDPCTGGQGFTSLPNMDPYSGSQPPSSAGARSPVDPRAVDVPAALGAASTGNSARLFGAVAKGRLSLNDPGTEQAIRDAWARQRAAHRRLTSRLQEAARVVP
jgi:hypothetical protein